MTILESMASNGAPYILVQAYDARGVQERVEAVMAVGKHVPLGGVSVAALMDSEGLLYTQAMVLR
jgi:hypothetical protein